MIVSPKDFLGVYQSIKVEMNSNKERKLVVYASREECDSVCAVKILQVSLSATM
jgi:hypothetical protein